ncbi:hypothetical protein AVA65_08265 [Salmonella enterica subsp. enterica serovar Minnesota]|nr:hypothetical protein [Salmonella enterica subsp. enterica serovar Minnesota]
MTTKNNFKAQRKAVKKRKAREQANAQANHRNRSQPKAKKKHPKYSEEFIHRYIQQHGFGRAVVDLKLEPTNTEFTNKDVAQMIAESIMPIARTHAGVEVVTRLAKEGTITLSPEADAVIVEYDKIVVKFNEDVDAVIALMEAKKEPEEYMELIQHLTEMLMELMSTFREPMIDLIENFKDLVEEYAKEHRPEGMSMDDYMMQLHTQRAEVIFPLYRTGLTVTEQADAEFDKFDAQHAEQQAADAVANEAAADEVNPA